MFISKKFTVNSDAGRMAAARYAAEDFAGQVGLSRRDTLRLELLVEETLGMVRTMLEDFYGQLWFVSDDACEIHFEATADMDADKKQDLLSVSSTGKNAAAKGFMAKLGEVISGAMHGFGQSVDAYGHETMRYGIVHIPSGGLMSSPDMMPIWTLGTYRDNLDQARGADGEAEEAWDELEKSIVARLADDVVVGVRGDRIDLIITRKF